MQIKQGTHVYTAAGDDLGSIDRIAINPRTKRVTHLIVRKGALLPQDKVIPMEMVAEAGEDRLTLSGDATSVDELPDFEEQHMVSIDEGDAGSTTAGAGYVPAFYWYPPAAGGYGARRWAAIWPTAMALSGSRGWWRRSRISRIIRWP